MLYALFEIGCGRHRLAGDHGVAHPVQFIDAVLQEFIDCRVRLYAPIVDRYQQRLELVTQIAHRRDSSHPRTALQCVQVPLEFFHRLLRVLVLAPLYESLVSGLEQLGRFFGEDRRDLGIIFRLFRRGADLQLRLRGKLENRFRNGFWLSLVGCDRVLWLYGVRQPGQVLDQRRIVCPAAFRLIDIGDYRGNRPRRRLQRI